MSTKRQLTKQQIKAVHLVVDDRLTLAEIAEQVGVTVRQLSRWKRNPLFIEETKRVISKFNEQLIGVGIATVRKRVEGLNDRHHRMQRVIEARAQSEDMREVPGGDTGILVKQYKGVGRGADFEIVEEFAVDTGLLREMRETEKQAAQEVGQWVEKIAPTDPSGQDEFSGRLTDDERSAAVAAVLNTIRARAAGQAAADENEVGATSEAGAGSAEPSV